jgi:hypothetical protein
MESKTCVDCKRKLLLDQFYKSKGNAGGLGTVCKSCHVRRNKISKMKSYSERNSALGLYKFVNRSKLRALARKRKAESISKMSLEELTEFRKNRLEGKRIHRAKKYGSGGRHSEKEWQFLLKLSGNKCLRCGAGTNLTRDHIVPLTKGGSDDLDNIQPLCLSCNCGKNCHVVVDYRTKDIIDAVRCRRK